jgi:hypothetical protein
VDPCKPYCSTLSYDALGPLHDVGASSHSGFLYDGTDVIEEYDGSGHRLPPLAPRR